MITQFFIPKDNHRYNEIKYCLKNNLQNSKIDIVYLLVERMYTNEELGIHSSKIIQINIGKRLCYSDFFSFIRENNLHGYIILCNSDIFIESESIENLKRSAISNKKQFFSLLRYEYKNAKPCIFGPRFDSQDTGLFIQIT